ncbi:unnamed protein product, partial [Prorocentrum cordatum]
VLGHHPRAHAPEPLDLPARLRAAARRRGGLRRAVAPRGRPLRGLAAAAHAGGGAGAAGVGPAAAVRLPRRAARGGAAPPAPLPLDAAAGRPADPRRARSRPTR